MIQAGVSRVAAKGSLIEKHPEPFQMSREAPKGPFFLLLGLFLSVSLKSSLICATLGSFWGPVLGHLVIPLEDLAWACPVAVRLWSEATGPGVPAGHSGLPLALP